MGPGQCAMMDGSAGGEESAAQLAVHAGCEQTRAPAGQARSGFDAGSGCQAGAHLHRGLDPFARSGRDGLHRARPARVWQLAQPKRLGYLCRRGKSGRRFAFALPQLLPLLLCSSIGMPGRPESGMLPPAGVAAPSQSCLLASTSSGAPYRSRSPGGGRVEGQGGGCVGERKELWGPREGAALPTTGMLQHSALQLAQHSAAQRGGAGLGAPSARSSASLASSSRPRSAASTQKTRAWHSP